MKLSTLEYFGSLDMILLNGYGLSETSGGIAIQTPRRFSFHAIGCGMPGCDLKIVNPDENG